MKKAFFYLNYDNVVVLKDYLDVLFVALENNGYTCKYVKDLKGIDKKSLIVFPMGNDAFSYYIKGFHNIVFWQQGATADESYLRHKSKLRKIILNFMDCFVIKRAKLNIFVSLELQNYYEVLMKKKIDTYSFIMPCFNDWYDKSIVNILDKDYNRHSFAYVGSLTDWQCFDETMDLYKQIEDSIDDAYLKVLTFQKEEATRIIKAKGIKNYIVKTVDKEEVKNELKDVNYGFVIRKDILVNRVATPTKFSSYLAAGVLPIYSDCLKDFSRCCGSYGVSLSLNSNSTVEDICSFIRQNKNNSIIESNVIRIFNTYYSSENYAKELGSFIKKIGI